MSCETGKRITCDRCDTEVFLKHTGEEEYDGGYTIVQTYEPLPEGWDNFFIRRKGKNKLVYLCTECATLYESLMDSFFGENDDEHRHDEDSQS